MATENIEDVVTMTDCSDEENEYSGSKHTYDDSSYPLVLNDEIIDRVLMQPCKHINDTIESIKVDRVGTDEYALNTNKGVDLDHVVQKGAGVCTYENRNEVDAHIRVLNHIDRLDKTLAGVTMLPDVVLDCTGTTQDVTYAIEDIPANLNPDRSERLFLSNVRHCISAKIFATQHGAGDYMLTPDKRIDDIKLALDLRCCRGEDCRYKSHDFPDVGTCGPVLLPNAIVSTLKFLPHAVTNPTLWNALIDSLTAGLHRYIQKAKKVNDKNNRGHPGADNMGKDENPSRDDEMIFSCVCCVLTKQMEYAVLRDNRLLPLKKKDRRSSNGYHKDATAVQCRWANSKFRFVLFSVCNPIKYGVSFRNDRAEINFAHDHLGLGKREVCDIKANFSIYNIERDKKDNNYVVKVMDDSSLCVSSDMVIDF